MIQRRKWRSVKTVIVIERTVEAKGTISHETAYFVSDLSPKINAEYFYRGTRTHWSIESFHFIKDVTFKEDAQKKRTQEAPQNYSMIRNFAINIFRDNNLHCIQAATEKCANNVPFMMTLI